MAKPRAGAAGKKPKAKKPGKPKAKEAARPVAAESAGGGRQLISKAHVRDLCEIYDKCKGRMSTLAGELGQATKDYVDKGLNGVAFTLANRIRRQAQRDPVKAAITLEDFQYILYECMEIEKMLGKSMLPAQAPQTRPPRGSRAKKDAEAESDATATGTADESNVHHIDDHREETANAAA